MLLAVRGSQSRLQILSSKPLTRLTGAKGSGHFPLLSRTFIQTSSFSGLVSLSPASRCNRLRLLPSHRFALADSSTSFIQFSSDQKEPQLKYHQYYLDQRDPPPQRLSALWSSCMSVTLWNLFTCLLSPLLQYKMFHCFLLPYRALIKFCSLKADG